MVFNVSRYFALLLGILFLGSTVLSAEVEESDWSVINPQLPYGITWEDNDSVIVQKIRAADTLGIDVITERVDGMVAIAGTELSDFTAKRVIFYTNGQRTIAAEWRLGGTRMLSPIAVYDYLRPALKIELGEPVAAPDTSVTPRQIRSSIVSDRQLYTRLRGSDLVLYTQWNIKRGGRTWLVDLRVDNESGDAILSITDREALALVDEAETPASAQPLPLAGRQRSDTNSSPQTITFTNGQTITLKPATPVGGVSIVDYIEEAEEPREAGASEGTPSEPTQPENITEPKKASP